MPEKIVNVMVEGGKATPGPPLGPALGGYGLNLGQVVKEINDKTKEFEGMKIPVIIYVDPEKKTYRIEIGTPPTSMLLLREMNKEKGSGNPKSTKIGDISMEKIVKIAKIKMKEMNTSDLAKAVKQVLGTAVSMGITVDGKDPREVQKEIDRGLLKLG
ncbi:MAG: 50S ribosomal protein L11 [Thermoproteota archaeon]|jgi:large subunit ribosomal protein L11|uniref:Large ribosomal subunit protein uL11 n=1 Tax=Candidatus Methanodesulfokora washburnensis TaxID=2478471 RepID=A0A429GI97_9CREN|nr:50S ribosomal protein L11 [Candidatus Methanodesulfokores washburnensis]RSN73622.1 50S ribosomal protein L11 [Candidatus Methanodesulfokores washburnensis]RZN61817.1 MAG: 50S ribosomal protein L11 [Candidatus Methanodesulfokores washburnensis]TDA41629.1 MAG: 50S ribosomal protein L11 [Candidatus Korarchaeota archaeon]